MGKANRATRKKLEEIVGQLIQEVQYLKQVFTYLDNYVGAYVRYKGDLLEFTDFIKKEYEKTQKVETSNPEENVKSDKKSRYKKVTTPPL